MSDVFHSGEQGTTGREPFEDSESRGLIPQQGSTGTGIIGSNTNEHHGHHHGHHGHGHHEGRGVGNGEYDGNAVAVEGSGEKIGEKRIGGDSATYGSNTAASNYLDNTPSQPTGGLTSGTHTGTGLSGTGAGTGLSGNHHTIGNASDGPLRLGEQTDTDRGKFETPVYDGTGTGPGFNGQKIPLNEGEELRDNKGASGNFGKPETFHQYGRGEGENLQTGDAYGTGRAATGDSSDFGNSGLGGANTSNYTDKTGDVSRSGAPYGQDIGDKSVTNQNAGRHGDDFTGGFAATGGAYTNEHAKTGLTGRETTTTGVNDQSGQATQTGGGGIMGKIKSVLGGHHSNETGANNSVNPEGSNIDTDGSTSHQKEIRQ